MVHLLRGYCTLTPGCLTARSAVLGSEFGGTNKTASDTIGFSASALNNLNRRMTHGDALQARQKLKALRQESEALLTSIHRSNQKIAQHDSAFNVILVRLETCRSSTVHVC